ncbi:MAG: glycoside hydrolase family 5 protein [Oscillospiraceae bacterium]|nr:glycoside hydrolase family 5 protein [Oscillospiraceae bacterium]
MNRKLLKRFGAAVTAAIMLASFAGCSKETAQDTPAETTVTEAVVVHDEIRDIPSTELVKEIKIGWSLGNTLDSTATGISAETAWGNIKTTKEMITAVKDAGFNGIRVPVTWGTHMDAENNVDEEWMNRVQEVVDYAYTQDMFVILNIHHEDWHDPYYDTAEASIAKLKALWTQIGTRFAEYDERLIFEGLNEPRKRNTNLEWNGGDKEGHEVVNQMNAAFVETIRGLGGNNEKRHLMLPTYAASSGVSAIEDFVLPEGDDKLIVSIHAYLPYSFALGGNMEQRTFTPDEGSASEILYLMETLNTCFISKGIPVIIGETGARSKANEDIRAEWATYYISKAKEIGIPCFIWDNGAFNGTGENFGLLNRFTCTWEFPAIIEGFMKGLE